MRGLDDGPDGLNDAAFDRALGGGRKRRGKRRPIEPVSAAVEPAAPGPFGADGKPLAAHGPPVYVGTRAEHGWEPCWLDGCNRPRQEHVGSELRCPAVQTSDRPAVSSPAPVTLPAWCTPGARVEFVDADWWPGVWTVGAEICAGHIEVSRGGAVVTCTPDDLRLVEAAPQPADVPPPADLDPHHRYLTAFDAVDAIGADLVLYDRRQPGAAAALELWAARRGKVVQYGDVEGWAGTLSVVVGLAGSPTSHEITVYLQG